MAKENGIKRKENRRQDREKEKQKRVSKFSACGLTLARLPLYELVRRLAGLWQHEKKLVRDERRVAELGKSRKVIGAVRASFFWLLGSSS